MCGGGVNPQLKFTEVLKRLCVCVWTEPEPAQAAGTRLWISLASLRFLWSHVLKTKLRVYSDSEEAEQTSAPQRVQLLINYKLLHFVTVCPSLRAGSCKKSDPRDLVSDRLCVKSCA